MKHEKIIKRDDGPSGLYRCSRCGETVIAEDIVKFEGGSEVCQYCIDEQIVRDNRAEAKQSRFIGIDYAPGDRRAYERLESAERNLKEAVKRYLRNCNSPEMVRIIVERILDG